MPPMTHVNKSWVLMTRFSQCSSFKFDGVWLCTQVTLHSSCVVMARFSRRRSFQFDGVRLSTQVTSHDGSTWIRFMHMVILCMLFTLLISTRFISSWIRKKVKVWKFWDYSTTMPHCLCAMPRRGRNSKGTMGCVVTCHSLSARYGAHIPFKVCLAMDDWEVEVVAHDRTTQPLRQRLSHYLCMKMSQLNCSGKEIELPHPFPPSIQRAPLVR